ncbi:MAG: phosphoribosylglycinamide formyltransferase [Natronincolaceae bacterium]|jgi:phosphoribosylglycinamide formyltransferase-1|nr:phosphoribosylglycinamide formyltransferase [Bacillota bacterium]NLK91500.1 phosphoribosylglycinamide formyltransferase [Clostridiales bacterium]
MNKTNIAVMISGSGTNLQALIDKIHNKDTGGNIELVISNNENAYGLVRARNSGIRTVVINKNQYDSALRYEETLVEILEKAEINLIVLAGYLAFVPDKILEIYENRIISIHPSLIPSFCGRGFYGERVHQAAIHRGVKISGATVHFVNKIVDGGPIIIQKCVNVDFNDTAESLQKKVLEIEHEILPLAVKFFIENRIRVIDGRVKVIGRRQ